MKFVRFGNLSAVEQEQYTTGEDKGFHNPPRRKGVYAFVHGYVEPFLIGSTMEPGHVSNKSMWLKDDDGNKILTTDFYLPYFYTPSDIGLYDIKIKPEWLKFLKRKKIRIKDIRSCDGYVTVLKKPKVFDYDGELWHHLGSHLKPHQIIQISGSWVKSSMEDYQIALEDHKKFLMKQKHSIEKEYKGYVDFDSKYDPFKSKGVNFSMDHLEVFIEKVN